MVLTLLLLAVTNLVAGYGLAVAMRADFWFDRLPALLPKKAQPLAPGETEQPAAVDSPPPSEETEAKAPSNEDEDPFNFRSAAPPAWLKTLDQAGIVPQSLVEAAAQVMRLEVARYRKELVTLENMTRDAAGASLGQSLDQICERLLRVNTAWISAQREAAQTLHDSADSFGEHKEIGDSLDAILRDQAAQIDATENNLRQSSIAQEAELGRQRLAAELVRLLDLAHRLRDRMQDSLGTILATEKRFEALDASMRVDPSTGCVSRLGLEVLLHDWQQQKDGRQLCFGMVDVDRFARVTSSFGAAAGDEILAELANVLLASIRMDRGFDRVCRVGGTTFVMFYGFTGPRNANSSLERVRQSIEATSFHVGEKSFDLTISGGVVEAQPNEKLPDLLKRAQKCVTEAKRKGRNRVALDEGAGPIFAEAPQYQVQARVIEVEKEPD